MAVKYIMFDSFSGLCEYRTISVYVAWYVIVFSNNGAAVVGPLLTCDVQAFMHRSLISASASESYIVEG